MRERLLTGRATYFVWLPLAASSPLVFLNMTVVYARLLPTTQGGQF